MCDRRVIYQCVSNHCGDVDYSSGGYEVEKKYRMVEVEVERDVLYAVGSERTSVGANCGLKTSADPWPGKQRGS